MSGNSFGHIFRFTTWGESHGTAIGCVIDGVPPLIDLSEKDLQPWLDLRKPGQNRFTTQRQESDIVEIQSGVFEGKTTGTSIGLVVKNTDQRSKDYSDIAKKFRPGHADYTYHKKYGIRDYRGGGRSAARETTMRVAAGGIARKIIDHLIDGDVKLRGALVQMGPHKIDYNNWDWGIITDNPFWCPDAKAAVLWEEYLNDIRKSGSSCGAVIELRLSGIPAGLGAPVYDKLDADIAKALMSINAVKAVEIGEGFDVAALTGEENADEMRQSLDKNDELNPEFLSNNSGGILGGISSGQEIIVRFAVKPTSSILTPRKTITISDENTEILTKGRHDPCVGIRAVPVGEAMLPCVIADHILLNRAQCG